MNLLEESMEKSFNYIYFFINFIYLFLLFKYFITITIMNYLNKRVIIVGPAEYLLKSNNKDFIDSFDIVIRIKSGYPVPKKYINNLGSKTNIIYSNLVPIRNNFTRNNLKEINKNNIIIKYPFPILKKN